MKHSVIVLLFLSCNLFANVVKQENTPFVISYVEHKGIIHYYVPLLAKAYRKIGIEPTFELINDKRALKLLDQGVIDADTAKSLEFIDSYKNIIVVPTPISQIDVVLLCQPKLQCDLSVFKNSNRSLGLIAAKEFYTELLSDSTISLIEFSSFETLLKIFSQDKVDYAIVVFDDYTKDVLANYPNHFFIQQKIGYHLLHKKHRAIVEQLDEAIKSVRAQGGFIKSN
ncbi:hypothetical protein HG263_00840 [Pseudoalteromonas sp. JBTF-M23]|uniref:Solute-binding protein family 3/N-terminal domain-containing protein n=1 Tax=Pseudoalteromonas caenipelagi TaxID=2726988 RepID=A0A849VBB3_9GAMM|nr:hypothetical protein [Pseudoalteromonas caenipelagi]NOU49097.1 hypothetical protein [Pseudoalteromonas caenipelagi]